MTTMTRSAARGVLAQLVKQQQAILSLHDALTADVELEASVEGLRAEHTRLSAAVETASQDAAKVAALSSEASGRLAQVQGAICTHEATLEQLATQITAAQRHADDEIKKQRAQVESAKAAQLAELERTMAARRDAAVRQHTAACAAMADELTALQARKDGLERGLADFFGQHGIRVGS